jgi:signal transduction histidine kinase
MTRLLLVDDDEISLELMADVLSRSGEYFVEKAADGQQALARVLKGGISIVVSDWMMPRLDGIELCRRIRKANLPYYTSFVLVTAQDGTEALERGLAAGADEFITKPFDTVELKARVRSIQRLQSMHANLERRVEERTHELLLAKEEALAASRLKSEFLTNISHELRTPLNGIIGMTDLALEEQLSEELRGTLETVADCSQDLNQLVDQILDLSTLETGNMKLQIATFDPGAMFRELVEQYADEARSKGLEFRSEIADSLPPALQGDSGRLRQALANMVGNAIKFTEHGYVKLRAIQSGKSAHQTRLLIEVEDSGIGIPDEMLESIFDSFVQADGSHTRRHGGAGIGLSVASNIIRLMGGSIDVESKAGQGSLFSVDVPLFQSAAAVTGEPVHHK